MTDNDMPRQTQKNAPDDFDSFTPSNFKPARFIFIIFLVMLFISQAIKWYSSSVTLPRFCEDPQASLHHLKELITKQTPAAEGRAARRPYIIAAKLIYLIPQKSNEANQDYLHRVQGELSQRCRQ